MGQERGAQGFGRKTLDLFKFGSVEGALGVKRKQGRGLWRVRHFFMVLLHDAPSRVEPQHRRGKE
jgi:hypothetical protein